MKVSKYLDASPSQELPGVVKREVVNADDGAPNFCMRVFEVDPGSATPWHSHPWEHEVYVVSGAGRTRGALEADFSAGDAMLVPAGEEHSFECSGGEPLRMICVVPKASG